MQNNYIMNPKEKVSVLARFTFGNVCCYLKRIRWVDREGDENRTIYCFQKFQHRRNKTQMASERSSALWQEFAKELKYYTDKYAK